MRHFLKLLYQEFKIRDKRLSEPMGEGGGPGWDFLGTTFENTTNHFQKRTVGEISRYNFRRYQQSMIDYFQKTLPADE